MGLNVAAVADESPEPPGITAAEEAPAAPASMSAPAQPVKRESTREDTETKLAKVVSLSFTNAKLKGVLSGLAKTYGLNIVADETVKGSVNITLRDVSLGDILKQILELNGYTYIWDGPILKVLDMEEETSTELLPLRFIDAEVAVDFLSSSSSEDGILKADELQNSILVTDTLSNISKMRKVLEKIDLAPQQVLIQAQLLDITFTDLDNLGLSLSSVAFDVPLSLSSGGDRILEITAGALNMAGSSSDLTTDTVTATVAKGDESITLTLDALIRDSRVKVLASPTVATLNNVEAKIVIGEKFPIAETTQTTTGTLQTTRFVDVGVTLRVTPKINRAGYIQMQIHPEVSSVSSTIDAGPRITTREADTTLIVKAGETVLIAGLIQEEETMIKDRIPFFGHIPIFGLLFQSRSKDYIQKELVIAITPHLMPVEPPHVVKGSNLEEVRVRNEVIQLWLEANDYEEVKSLQARETPEEIREYKAIDLYDSLAVRFPDHPFAPRALWKVGELSRARLQDYFRAEEAYRRLVTQYSDHRYARQAEKRLRGLQARRERQEKRQKKIAAKQNKASQAKSGTPFGFR